MNCDGVRIFFITFRKKNICVYLNIYNIRNNLVYAFNLFLIFTHDNSYSSKRIK